MHGIELFRHQQQLAGRLSGSMMLYCSCCKEEKSPESFNKANTNRQFQRWCRSCASEYTKNRRPLLNERQKSKRRLLPGDSGISRFGLTQDQYASLLQEQGGVCAICKQVESDSNRARLSVDHDHYWKYARGLLCARCNRGLGLALDKRGILLKAAAYLYSQHNRSSTISEKDSHWINMCENSARRFSTCSKAAYFAIIIDRDGFQASQGWNGVPSGEIHCLDGGCLRATDNSEAGSSYANCTALHAEVGAILRAGPRILGSTLYVNGPPCFECSKMIVSAGIVRVVYVYDPAYSKIAESRFRLFGSGAITWVGIGEPVWGSDEQPEVSQNRAIIRTPTDRTCTSCYEVLPLQSFYPRANGWMGYQSKCKSCSNSYQRKYKYSATKQMVDDLLRKQNNMCAVCSRSEPLVVDHNHANGKVRGMLCHHCNAMLGCFRDDPVLLMTASAYLNCHLLRIENSPLVANRPEEGS